MDRQVALVWSPSQAAAQREAKRKPVFYTYMNLWPFVGVMFALLFAFLGDATPMHRYLWVPVDLPASIRATPQRHSLREDAMRVSVTRNGQVYFRDFRVSPQHLPEAVREAVRGGAERKVYLAVDARAKYGDAAAVAKQIGNAGITEICILAYKREE